MGIDYVKLNKAKMNYKKFYDRVDSIIQFHSEGKISTDDCLMRIINLFDDAELKEV